MLSKLLRQISNKLQDWAVQLCQHKWCEVANDRYRTYGCLKCGKISKERR